MSTKTNPRTDVSTTTHTAGIAHTIGGQAGQADPRQAGTKLDGTLGPGAAGGVKAGRSVRYGAALAQAGGAAALTW
jgi:hypothetical protein